MKARHLSRKDLGSTEERNAAAPLISFSLGGFRMRNPVMLASGILGVSPALLHRVANEGAGAMVLKSVSVKRREGYRNPTAVEVEGGFVNAVGLSNPGVEAFAEELQGLGEKPIPVVASLFGSTDEEFQRLVSVLEEVPVDCYEMNLSCPHVAKVGLETGQDPEVVSELVRAVKEGTSRPVLVKISPNAADVGEIAGAAEAAGADGITAVNTVRAMVIDVETGVPVLSNRVGGLSGPAIRPIAVRCVYDVSRRVRIPVIGCGGISSWRDAVEFLLAGASAVQVGSAVSYRGLSVFREIVDGIRNYMVRHGLKDIGEIVGRAHT